ncbi:Uncharacterised protein [Serratia ficaria]|nr:Uncharacterised protein [Serratia ficaria]
MGGALCCPLSCADMVYFSWGWTVSKIAADDAAKFCHVG